MILADIKRYFIDHQAASLSDLSIHFNVDPDVMRDMLGQWMRKGKLRKLPEIASCPSCCKECNSNHSEIYEWVC